MGGRGSAGGFGGSLSNVLANYENKIRNDSTETAVVLDASITIRTDPLSAGKIWKRRIRAV